jgi:Tol biopolymer transport system component
VACYGACLTACDSSPTQPPTHTTLQWLRITDPALVPQADNPQWRGDSIAFDYADTTGNSRIGVMRFDGTGTTLYTDPVPSREIEPAWVTPSLLVYASNKAGAGLDNFDLWYRDLASDQTRRLTSFAEKEFGPSPRPGLPSLLYTEGASPSTGRITLVPDTAATTVTRLYLTPSNLVAGEGSWDAPGNRVCYAVEDPDGSKHIWTLTLAGTSVVSSLQMTTGVDHDSSPRFSPDGKRILFVSDRGGRSGVWWTSDTGEANGLERIGYEDPGATIRAPSWSPDGKQIVLSSDGRGGRAIWVLSNLGF